MRTKLKQKLRSQLIVKRQMELFFNYQSKGKSIPSGIINGSLEVFEEKETKLDPGALSFRCIKFAILSFKKENSPLYLR